MAAMSSWCWLVVLVCLCGFWLAVELGFLQLKLTSISQETSNCVASAHNMHLRGCNKHVVLRVCFIQDGIIVHNSALLQFRYPTLGPKLCLEYLFESFTDQLLSDRHVGCKRFSFDPFYARASAHIFKLFLLVSMVYVLCFLLMCHICCIAAYTSLSRF